MRARFRNPEIAVAIEMTDRAWKAYNTGDLSEAGTVAREALRVFQEERVLAGEYRVLSLISLLSLAKQHGDDSVVYLEYALENAGRMHDRYATLCTLFDTTLVHFILGNFHYSVCTLETVDQIVERCYAKNWEVLVLFMKGRIALALGDYRNAELYFQTAASLASFHHIPESVSLCRVWYARAIILQGAVRDRRGNSPCVRSVHSGRIRVPARSVRSFRPKNRGCRHPPIDCESVFIRRSLVIGKVHLEKRICHGRGPLSRYESGFPCSIPNV